MLNYLMVVAEEEVVEGAEVILIEIVGIATVQEEVLAVAGNVILVPRRTHVNLDSQAKELAGCPGLSDV